MVHIVKILKGTISKPLDIYVKNLELKDLLFFIPSPISFYLP